MTFGENLKQLRQIKGWNQQELAKLLGLKISSISSYEIGDRYPRLDTIIKLVKLFDISFEELFDEELKKTKIETLK